MTVTDEIKILDKKIMQNEAQYDLDRKAAKISALSSGNLDKYWTFDWWRSSNKLNLIILSWINFFNKGLKEEDKKEGLLKRLRNIKVRMKNN